jgi:hypothetical protein
MITARDRKCKENYQREWKTESHECLALGVYAMPGKPSNRLTAQPGRNMPGSWILLSALALCAFGSGVGTSATRIRTPSKSQQRFGWDLDLEVPVFQKAS